MNRPSSSNLIGSSTPAERASFLLAYLASGATSQLIYMQMPLNKMERTTNGATRRHKLIPHAFMAPISLSIDNRPKRSNAAKSVLMGMENERI